VVPPDRFVALAAGRCEFGITDLLAAVQLVAAMRELVGGPGHGVKETSP